MELLENENILKKRVELQFLLGYFGHQKCTLESCFKALIISRVAPKGSNGLSSVEPLHNGRLGDRRKWPLYRGLTL